MTDKKEQSKNLSREDSSRYLTILRSVHMIHLLDPVIFLASFQLTECRLVPLTSLNLRNDRLQKLNPVNQPLNGCEISVSGDCVSAKSAINFVW